MECKLNVCLDDHLNSLSDEELRNFVLSKMNYGWELVSIEKTKSIDFDYTLIFNWNKDIEPTTKPIDTECELFKRKIVF